MIFMVSTILSGMGAEGDWIWMPFAKQLFIMNIIIFIVALVLHRMLHGAYSGYDKQKPENLLDRIYVISSGILAGCVVPYLSITIVGICLLIHGVDTFLKNIGKNVATPKDIHTEQKTQIVSSNKYKTMLSDAVEAISKYHANLSKTKLTPEGKAIVVAVGASIGKVSQIIKNSNSERITIDVFEKAYQAIKANRIELQRAEKLVSLGIEDQLEQEIKLMKATLPR